MIDRVKGPKIFKDFDIVMPPLEQHVLSNGLEVFALSSETQPIIKLDLCFKAGRIQESKKAASRACLNMMKEATKSHDSDSMSNLFDYYGAECYVSLDLDTCRISLLCLDKYLPNLLPVWLEIIYAPRFDSHDFENYKSLSSQKLKLQLSKNEILAYRVLTQEIFGVDHPYGYNTFPEDIMALSLNDIRSFYDEKIGLDEAALFISGRLSQENRSLINKTFEEAGRKSADAKESTFTEAGNKRQRLIINEGNPHQVSVKLGARLFERRDSDFSGVYVLNTILGGYFGSRLMTNIRELKGYSYNIYSVLECMRKDGFWYVAADVAHENAEDTLREIKNEIKLLQEDLVGKEELNMVKNYLHGYLLGMLDGPFAISKVLQGAWKYDLGLNYVEDFAALVGNIDNEEIRKMARKHLQIEDATEVFVGKNKIVGKTAKHC